MSRPHKKWTDEDLTFLKTSWGILSMSILSEKMGRTRGAIRERARILKLAPRSRGCLSLNQMSRKLGYHCMIVRRIAQEVGIDLEDRRLNTIKETKQGRYAFSWDDYYKIEERINSYPNPNKLVPEHKWGVDPLPESCLDCEKTDRDHVARGLCTRCYAKRRRVGRLEERSPVKLFRKF